MESSGHVVIAPVTARGRELGFLSLTRGDGEPFPTRSTSLCAEIGRRAGLALDNAQLVREAREASAAPTSRRSCWRR